MSDDLSEKIKKLDLSQIDVGEASLNAAESLMQAYGENKHSKNASAYLHTAETNLMSARRQGVDTSQHYKRLEELKQDLSRKSL